MDKKQIYLDVEEKVKVYLASLTEDERIGVQVAREVIPHIYSIERSYGFHKFYANVQKNI